MLFHSTRVTIGLLLLFSFLPTTGLAACPALPFNLTNGQVADATQVMANYEALRDCISDVGAVGLGQAGEVATYVTNGNEVSGAPLSEVLDGALTTIHGSIIYRGALQWEALPPGTAGYVLQSAGPNADPTWVAGGGGGGGISTIVGGGVASGAATVALPFIPIISRPALSAFTWVNQSSATATDHSNGPLALKTAQVTSGGNMNALVKAVMGASWTVTFNYAQGYHLAGANLDTAGIVVYNSVNTRMYVLGLTGGPAMELRSYSTPTSWAGNVASKATLQDYRSIWSRVSYDSLTTRITFYHSIDGFTWEQVYTTTSPYIGTPTHYGIAVGAQGNSAGYLISLNHMLETSP